MNKNDLKLIVLLIIFSIIIMLFINKKDDTNKIAKVYHNNKLILKIDLSKKESKEYYVKGDKGKIKIITNNGKIKVAKENSYYHLCSKQGFIKETYESIVCLPNKVVIEIDDNNTNIDTIVK